MDHALLPTHKREEGSPQDDQEGAMQKLQRHAPPQVPPEASHQRQRGQHTPQRAEPSRVVDMFPDEGRAAGLFDKRCHRQHDHQGTIYEKNETLHQNGA